MQRDNGFLQGLKNPMPNLSVIDVKIKPDNTTVKQFMANGRNAHNAATTVPGGTELINHDMLPGEIVISRKGAFDYDSDAGDPHQLGFVSLNGANYGDCCSQRQFDSMFRFCALAVAPYRYTSPNDSGNYDQGPYFAGIRCGMGSTINTGQDVINAGDIIGIRAPLTPLATGAPDQFNGGSNINCTARLGTPHGKFGVELYPWCPYDSQIVLDGLLATFRESHAVGGISGKHIRNLLPSALMNLKDERPLDCAQDETAAFTTDAVFTGAMFLLALLRNGVVEVTNGAPKDERESAQDVENVLRQLQFFDAQTDNADKRILMEFIGDLLINHVPACDPDYEAIMNRFQEGTGESFSNVATSSIAEADINDVKKLFARLRASGKDPLVQSVHGTMNYKLSKRIGTALNSSVPGEQQDMALGFYN